MARAWELPVWEKPASPCLSSRIAPGVEVTAERTQRIEQAELLLRRLGLAEVRVRYHAEDLARLEVPLAELETLTRPAIREELTTAFKALGFRYVTLDLEGFRSGSLNALIPLEIRNRFAHTPPGSLS